MLKTVLAAAGVGSTLAISAVAQAQSATDRSGAARFMVVNVAANDVLNVRSGPSSDHAVVAELQPGSGGITITGSCQSTWCPIQHAAATGWVNRRFIGRDARIDVALRPDDAATVPDARSRTVDLTKHPTEIAFTYFLAQGWSEHQAAGIVGNLQAECGPDLTCSNGSGGIAQWRGDRVTRFREVFGYSFAKATLADQLAYIHWEMTDPRSPWKDAGHILKGASDVADAAALFDIHYERSAGTSRSKRISNARAILKRFAGRSS